MDNLGKALGSAVNDQFAQVESEAQTIVTVVAIWAAIISIELGVLIFFAARKGK